MNPKVAKNLLIILFLLIFLGLIWLLNQKKNFNPVLSFKTNLSLRSEKNLNYNDLASFHDIYNLLKSHDSGFMLIPNVRSGDFSVIGRSYKSSDQEVSVFEYANNSKATQEFKIMQTIYPDRLLVYKNFILLTNENSKIYSYLKDNLND
jgi:hypothetical protein